MDQPTLDSPELSSGAALRILYRALPLQRRRQVRTTFVLMLVGALAEVVSVGSILPFLAVLTNPDQLGDIPVVKGLISGLPARTDLVGLTATAFILMFIISGLLRLLLAWISQSLSFNIANDLSIAAFAKLIRQPYPYYLERNSGEALSQFEKLHTITFTVLLSGVQAVISSVIAVLLLALLVAVNPIVALVSSGLLIGTYLFISVAVQPLLKRNSDAGSFHATQRIKRVQEALGGIRDILLDRSQPAFERDFAYSADRFRRASALNNFINVSPRILIEMLGMAMIGVFAWRLAGQRGGVTAAIPMLGALALGAQRLLPLLQQSYVGWSSVLGNHRNILDVVELLQLEDRMPPAPASDKMAFCDTIRFVGVTYSYPTGGRVLSDIDFTIVKGDRIGIAGTTGSGKSTLMDLLLGLLEPEEGGILIDGRCLDDRTRAAWQAEIAHVPQVIHLTDDTLAANIAFGVPAAAVDHGRVVDAARAAGIADFVDRLADGYATRTGERGVRLSGGQRQRIGIARALYKRASVLVFDEATSALDTRTEEGIMGSVAALGKDITIVMIAHRLTTLKDCDRIIHLENGRIDKVVERGAAAVRRG